VRISRRACRPSSPSVRPTSRAGRGNEDDDATRYDAT
jgi:hypothetical protein